MWSNRTCIGCSSAARHSLPHGSRARFAAAIPPRNDRNIIAKLPRLRGCKTICYNYTVSKEKHIMPLLRTYAEPVNDTVMVKIPKEYASYSFQVILVPCNVTPRSNAAADIHIFDSLHTDWGGTGSASEIADSIRSARHTNRQSELW